MSVLRSVNEMASGHAPIYEQVGGNIVQRTLGWNVLEMFLWQVFLKFSEHLFGIFLHGHQEIFTEYLTCESPHICPLPPIHADHPQFYIFHFVFCFVWNNVEHVNYIYLMKNLPRKFPEGENCPDLVGTF